MRKILLLFGAGVLTVLAALIIYGWMFYRSLNPFIIFDPGFYFKPKLEMILKAKGFRANLLETLSLSPVWPPVSSAPFNFTLPSQVSATVPSSGQPTNYSIDLSFTLDPSDGELAIAPLVIDTLTFAPISAPAGEFELVLPILESEQEVSIVLPPSFLNQVNAFAAQQIAADASDEEAGAGFFELIETAVESINSFFIEPISETYNDLGESLGLGGPKFDFGDAPDPSFPSLFISNGARHSDVTKFYLGKKVDIESDAQLVNQDSQNPDIGPDDGVSLVSGEPPALSIEIHNSEYPENKTIYLNVLFDTNKNSHWDVTEQNWKEHIVIDKPFLINKDESEYASVKLPIPLKPGELPWLRVTVTDIPLGKLWAGSWPAVFAFGETEDYYLPPPLTPVKFPPVHLIWVSSAPPTTGDPGKGPGAGDGGGGSPAPKEGALDPGAGAGPSSVPTLAGEHGWLISLLRPEEPGPGVTVGITPPPGTPVINPPKYTTPDVVVGTEPVRPSPKSPEITIDEITGVEKTVIEKITVDFIDGRSGSDILRAEEPSLLDRIRDFFGIAPAAPAPLVTHNTTISRIQGVREGATQPITPTIIAPAPGVSGPITSPVPIHQIELSKTSEFVEPLPPNQFIIPAPATPLPAHNTLISRIQGVREGATQIFDELRGVIFQPAIPLTSEQITARESIYSTSPVPAVSVFGTDYQQTVRIAPEVQVNIVGAVPPFVRQVVIEQPVSVTAKPLDQILQQALRDLTAAADALIKSAEDRGFVIQPTTVPIIVTDQQIEREIAAAEEQAKAIELPPGVTEIPVPKALPIGTSIQDIINLSNATREDIPLTSSQSAKLPNSCSVRIDNLGAVYLIKTINTGVHPADLMIRFHSAGGNVIQQSNLISKFFGARSYEVINNYYGQPSEYARRTGQYIVVLRPDVHVPFLSWIAPSFYSYYTIVPVGESCTASDAELSAKVQGGVISNPAVQTAGGSITGNVAVAATCGTITLNDTLPDGSETPPVAYNGTVTATDSAGVAVSFTYAVTAGSLPDGLTLDANTGIITGTPTRVDTFVFTITATANCGTSGSRAYSVTVLGGGF